MDDTKELPQPYGLQAHEVANEKTGDIDYHHMAERSKRVEQIAQVCHEANRAWCEIHNDSSQQPWKYAADWQRQSAITGVKARLAGSGPEALHESWCIEKLNAGWTYGPVKDSINKTHPCLVPYASLPAEQQLKDHLFAGIVTALAAGL